MGGEGSMMHAIKSLKENRALLKRRKIRELKDVLAENQKTGIDLEFKQVSPSELLRIKRNIRRKARERRQREMQYYALACLLIALIAFWIGIHTP